MMAATWPFSTASVRPLRIFLPSTSTCRFFTSSNIVNSHSSPQRGNLVDQLVERALGAAAEIDRIGRRGPHVFGDMKAVGAGAARRQKPAAAFDDQVLVLTIDFKIGKMPRDAVDQLARRLVASQAGRHLGFQFCPVEAHPTLPSSEIEISFCASTANSIGSCCSTSLTKPLTTSAVASSADMPRCWQ